MPLVDQAKPAAQSLGAGMYASLMGTFDLPAPMNYIGSTTVGKSITTVVDSNDPWVLPTPHEPEVPLSVVEVAYQAITEATVDPIPDPLTVSNDLEEVYFPAWAENSLHSIDCLDTVLPSDEAILEAMTRCGKICEDIHHRSYFLPELSRIEYQEFHMRLSEDVYIPINPLPREGMFAEGNMVKISATIPINISINPNVVENIYIGVNCSPEEIAIYTALFKEFRDVFSWSYEEMPGTDPLIVEHEI